MQKAFLLILIGSVLGALSSAQSPPKQRCPTIDIVEPAGVPALGELERYTLAISEPNKDFKYRWTVNAGEIKSGQGTTSVEVERSEPTLVVTVTVEGLPDGCPTSFSEASTLDARPQPTRVGVLYLFDGQEVEKKLKEFADELTANPTNQGYIILGWRPEANHSEIDAREKKIQEGYRKFLGYHPPRITLVRWGGKADVIELWRIPPGADNPVCRECDSLQCPRISVVGPPGISRPGETMKFIANLDPKDLKPLNFHWSLSAGSIIRGQGTPTIEVQTTREMNFTSVTATVEVSGLPNDCPKTASEIAAIAGGHPYPMDEFGRLPLNDIKGRLDNLLHYVAETKDQNGYIVLRHPKGVSRTKLQQRIRRITDHVFKFRKFPKTRIVILVEPSDREYTVLWRTTPDFGDHICPECEKY